MRAFTILSFYLFLFYFCYSQKHLAGDITYSLINGNNYSISVIIYSDTAITGTEICEVVICFGDGDSAIAPRVNGLSTICFSPNRNGQIISSHLKKSHYYITHVYSGDGNYLIRCRIPNRNVQTINYNNSQNSFLTLEALLIINSGLHANNTSPTFGNLPIDTGYFYQNFQHLVLASDLVDNDSIKVSLIPGIGLNGYFFPNGTNFNSGNSTFNWINPQPLPPAGNSPQRYNYTFKIEEFRLIGSAYYQIGYVTQEFFMDLLPHPSSTHQSQFEFSVSLFPNPAQHQIQVQVEGANLQKITMTDILGREFRIPIENPIDISLLKPGVYLVRVETDKGVVSKKLVKN
jgi:hypothetical protein